MTHFPILLFDLGEFAKENPMVIFAIVMAVAGAIGGYADLRSRVSNMRNDVDEVMDDLATHTKNVDAHVNKPYIGTLEQRVTNIETGMTSFRKEMSDEFKSVRADITTGHDKLGDKIDRLLARK